MILFDIFFDCQTFCAIFAYLDYHSVKKYIPIHHHYK